MRVWFAMFATLLPAAIAMAQGSVVVTVDRDTVVQGETFRITVQATGDRLGEPEFPEVEGLQITPHAVFRNSQTSIINGRTSTSKVRGYNAVALQPGPITIPPIGIRIGDDISLSEPITINVVPERRSAAGRGSGSRNQQLALDEVLQLTVDVDKNEVYQGEPIRVSLTLWAMGGSQVRQYSSEYPATTGFYALPREPRQIDNGVSATRDGRQFTAVHWEQTLYPTKTGDLEIGPWIWSGVLVPPLDMNVTMSARNVKIATDPVAITVRPLPQPPKGFGGAVGYFDVAVRKPSASPIRGVPFDLVVTIVGRGNPDAIQAPALPEVDWAYVAEPKREHGRDPRTGHDVTERTYVYTITPMEDGRQEMPGIEFCYFDPELEDYTVAATDPLEWEVRTSTESDQQIVIGDGNLRANGVEVLGRDILPIVTNTTNLKRRSSLAWAVPPLAIGPALAYGGLAFFIRRRRRLGSDSRYARAHRATRLAKRRLASVHELPDPLDGLYKALAGYVADVFNLQESGMTSADVENELARNGIEDHVASGIIRILKTCERSRYGAAALSDDEVNALVHGALLNIEQLDSVRGQGGVR